MSAIKRAMFQVYNYLDTLGLSLEEVNNTDLLESLILGYEEEANIGFGEEDVKSLIKGYLEYFKDSIK